jgi:hypothetical protein
MTQSELEPRAEQHANEAERLLAGRLSFINNVIRRAFARRPPCVTALKLSARRTSRA